MARNALLSAGHEMGTDGPHWPIIKLALSSLARSYEALKIEEEMTEQLRIHMKEALDNYETLLESFAADLDANVMAELRKFVADLRDIYTARFDDIDDKHELLNELNALAGEIDGMLSPEDASLIINQRLGTDT